MKDFIINLLNTLGLGINGVITFNAELFIERLETYVPTCKLSIKRFGEGELVIECQGLQYESFTLHYYFDRHNRIIDLQID